MNDKFKQFCENVKMFMYVRNGLNRDPLREHLATQTETFNFQHFLLQSYVVWTREKGGPGMFITLVNNFFKNNVLLFVWLTTLGTLVNFNWLVHKVE